jgi:protoheme IX farnesyltransferase
MMPVVAGPQSTRRQIFWYSLALAVAAIAPWPLGFAGPIYGVAAAALSIFFVVLAARVLATRAVEATEMRPEKRLFAFSIFFLFALFTAVVADRWLPW